MQLQPPFGESARDRVVGAQMRQLLDHVGQAELFDRVGFYSRPEILAQEWCLLFIRSRLGCPCRSQRRRGCGARR